MKKLSYYVFALGAGFLNGLLGAGGGMLIVPILKKCGLSQRNTHATSVFAILPMCILSTIIYSLNGRVSIYDALQYIPFGIIGAIIGSFILSKINQKLLRKLFGIFMIWAAIQLLVK